MHILTLDYETYWTKPAEGYTLSKMPASLYVMDPRFKAHGVAVKLDGGPSKWVTHDDIPAFFDKVPWNKVFVLGQNCLSADTEVLTPSGWVRFDKYEDGIPVMGSDENGVSRWEMPLRTIRKPYTGRMHEWHSGMHRGRYTANHRMVVRTPRTPWTFDTAESVASRGKTYVQMRRAGMMDTSAPCALREDEALVRFAEAVRADGYLSGERSVRWNLSKPRKIARLQLLAEAAGVHLVEGAPRTDGVRRFTAPAQDRVREARRLFEPGSKVPSISAMTSLGFRCREAWLDELQFWDGNTPLSPRSSPTVATACPRTADALQVLAHVTGYQMQFSVVDNCRGYGAKSVGLKIRSAAIICSDTSLPGYKRSVEEVDGEPVYCFTMPRGAFYARREGKVFVTGNSAEFDNMITEWIYGKKALGYIDTISMARAVLGVKAPGFSLDKLGEFLGLGGKHFYDALTNTQGIRDLPPHIEKALIPYAIRDNDLCYAIFKTLQAGIPPSEWITMSWCALCAVRPTLALNGPMLWEAHHEEVERKKAIVSGVGFGDYEAGKKIFNSNDKFAALLKPLLDAYGEEIPTKASKGKTSEGKLTYAFSASDEEFVALQDHPDERIAELVEARLAVKGSIVETRTKRMAEVADIMPGSLWPVGLKYSGAMATGRFSGSAISGGNCQNLKRGSKMKEAVIAPEGKVIVAGDLSQIELRNSAYMAGHDDILDMLRQGGDLYSYFASHVYEREINKDRDPDERQIGKVAVLSLGYEAAYEAFMRMLLVQAKKVVTPEFAQHVVKVYRETYAGYPDAWRRCRSILAAWCRGEEPPEDRLINLPPSYKIGVAEVTTPSGLKLKYHGLTQRKIYNRFRRQWVVAYVYPSEEKKKAFWICDENGNVIDDTTKWQKIHGSLLFENFSQNGAREVMAVVQAKLRQRAPWMRQALQVHDELVTVVPESRAVEAGHMLLQVMNEPVDFWPGLPIAAEVGIHKSYGLLKKLSPSKFKEAYGV
jgi:DNA polymerase